jgi:hypothetical protein
MWRSNAKATESAPAAWTTLPRPPISSTQQGNIPASAAATVSMPVSQTAEWTSAFAACVLSTTSLIVTTWLRSSSL